MFIEDLPMWGYIGDISGEDITLDELENSKTHLFPHIHFHISIEEDNHHPLSDVIVWYVESNESELEKLVTSSYQKLLSKHGTNI